LVVYPLREQRMKANLEQFVGRGYARPVATFGRSPPPRKGAVMASIGPVTLSIFDQPPGNVLVQVSYKVEATHHDMGHEQAYREVVELIGVDTLAGEDQVDDIIILDPPFWDGIVQFTQNQGPSNKRPRRR
jgi:hypothetical protein